MRETIKKVLREALGVPEGILESSNELYEIIKREVGDLSGDLEDEYVFDIDDVELNIIDLEINQINFTLSLEITDYVSSIQLLGMAYGHHSSFDNKSFKILSISDDGRLKLTVRLVVPEDSTIEDVKDFIDDDSDEILESLSHELGHFVNHNKEKFVNIKKISSYFGLTQLNTPFYILNKFLHYVYFIHNIENLVRPIEIASGIKNGDIDREGFYEFIINHRTYKILKEINQFSYNKMIEELYSEIDKVKQFLIKYVKVPIEELTNDEEIINTLLKVIYSTLVNKRLSTLQDLMTSNPFEAMLGFIGNKDKIFKSMVDYFSKFESDPNKFYIKEIENMNKVSFDMMKKISKVYALAKKKK